MQAEKKDDAMFLKVSTNTSYNVIVIDNFYADPLKVRAHALSQNFEVRGNFPGERTISNATVEIKAKIQSYLTEDIIDFGLTGDKKYNGAFQVTTSHDRSWVHVDPHNNWAGMLFLTPNAPSSAGTGFYQFEDGSTTQTPENKDITDMYARDITKWKLVDRIGNVFNRLVLFNSKRFHMSMDYFGTTKENGRLFQVFFFSTKEQPSTTIMEPTESTIVPHGHALNKAGELSIQSADNVHFHFEFTQTNNFPRFQRTWVGDFQKHGNHVYNINDAACVGPIGSCNNCSDVLEQLIGAKVEFQFRSGAITILQSFFNLKLKY
jgi:Family of unknown function (DUF6445)